MKMTFMRWYAILLIPLLFIAQPAVAYDGNDLLKWADDYEKQGNIFYQGVFSGYVSAIRDYHESYGHLCIRGSTQNRQLLDITVRYLKNHPEARDAPAHILVYTALQEVYPCNK